MTGLDFITGALRLIGALSTGEVPPAEEASDGLVILNQMLDFKNARRLNIFTVPRLGPFNLTPGIQQYQVGLGAVPTIINGVSVGAINIPRPPKIESMGIINLGNPIEPLELPLDYMTDDAWKMIPVKNIQSALPLRVWDDKGFPFRNLYFWCVPNVAVQCVIYAWAALGVFPDLSTDMQFPTAYAPWIKYNLALWLAPEWGLPVPPDVRATAMELNAAVQDLNIPLSELRCDEALIAPGQELYNWITDGPVRR